MELFAAGFNAWNQLDFSRDPPDEPSDLASFVCLVQGASIRAVMSHLSCTVVSTSGGVLVAGETLGSPWPEATVIFASCAQASNGLVVATSKQHTRRVFQFDSWAAALQAHEADPGLSTERPILSLDGGNDALQLVAHATGFLALDAATGEVWSWGDGRFAGCLGREVDGESPASSPGLVRSLMQLPTGRVTKLAACPSGYLVAALTAGRDLYVFGYRRPGGSSSSIGGGGDGDRSRSWEDSLLSGEQPGSPEPVEVALCGEEAEDVVDVGVGEAHAVVLGASGRVYVVGENGNGQLGIGKGRGAGETNEGGEGKVAGGARGVWQEVDLRLRQGRRVVAVAAGPRCSFVVTGTGVEQ